jgi:hypothetical protein
VTARFSSAAAAPARLLRRTAIAIVRAANPKKLPLFYGQRGIRHGAIFLFFVSDLKNH